LRLAVELPKSGALERLMASDVEIAYRTAAPGPSPRQRLIFGTVTFVLGMAWLGQMIWLVGFIIRSYPVPHPYEPLPFIGSLFRVIASGVFIAESVIVFPLYLIAVRAVYFRRERGS
jgi:hypothetical protein